MVLRALKTSLGRVNRKDMTRERLIEFGRKRAAQGAGPATIAIDFSFIQAILLHAGRRPRHRCLCRECPTRPSCLGTPRPHRKIKRARSPSHTGRAGSTDRIRRVQLPTISSARKNRSLRRRDRNAQAEIFRIEWTDVDMLNRTVAIRDRKDPRRKEGNHQVVPLLNSTGYDAWQIILEQRILTRGLGRVFPYHLKPVGAAFPRSCNVIDIADSCFHDLRHEGNQQTIQSRFFDTTGCNGDQA